MSDCEITRIHDLARQLARTESPEVIAAVAEELKAAAERLRLVNHEHIQQELPVQEHSGIQ
jgi:hypothetical protein